MNWSAALRRGRWQQVMPDDHSEVVPLLPIPNRTVKRLCADDSADSRVKVGHRQAIYIASNLPQEGDAKICQADPTGWADKSSLTTYSR